MFKPLSFAAVLVMLSAANALSTPEAFLITGTIGSVELYDKTYDYPAGAPFFLAHVGDSLSGIITLDPATVGPYPGEPMASWYSIAGTATITNSHESLPFTNLGGNFSSDYDSIFGGVSGIYSFWFTSWPGAGNSPVNPDLPYVLSTGSGDVSIGTNSGLMAGITFNFELTPEATANTTDPAQTTTPEPNTFALLALTCAGFLARCVGKRHRQNAVNSDAMRVKN